MLPDIQPGNTKILYFFNCLLDGMHTKLLTMIKISLVRLQKSLVYHQNIFRKAQSYLPKKDYLPMHLPDVILQENPLRIWYMRHRERLYWNWQKKSPV